MIRFLVAILLILSLFLSISLTFTPRVEAIIRQQEEAPGQILYQSRHSLRDEKGKTWQIILFKRFQEGKVQDLDLRLVGFPDEINFTHPHNLEIVSSSGKIFTAMDQFADKSPAPNVGQYDLKDILPQLPTNEVVRLFVPLSDSNSISIKIPIPVLLEWQEINR